jgi:hypothetical protein
MSNNAVFLSGKFLSLAALSCFIALAAIFYQSDGDSPKTEAKTNFAALQDSHSSPTPLFPFPSLCTSTKTSKLIS